MASSMFTTSPSLTKAEKGENMTKTAICADFEIELTPKRVHEKVEMLKDCYRPYDLFSWQVLGLVSHKGLPICILRVVNRGGRAIKCYIRLWWCVVLASTHTGDA